MGECCVSLNSPPIRLRSDRTFTTTREYSTFAGAGCAKSTVLVTGSVSETNQTLLLTYTDKRSGEEHVRAVARQTSSSMPV